MKSTLALLATATGILSCDAFTITSLSRTSHVRPMAIFSTADEFANEQSFAPDQVSRRTFTSTAAATLGVGIAGMVTAPGYAEAYQAPLDAQVKAIESANYMVSFGPCGVWAVFSVLPALWRHADYHPILMFFCSTHVCKQSRSG